MAEDLEKPPLRHGQLHGIAEYREALDGLAGIARRRLRIFDFNLEDGGYDTARRHDLLRAFLLGNRGNRLEIVLHDADYLTRFCPCMFGLLRQFSHAVAIMETTPQAKGIYDPFAVVDQADYVHRFHYAAPRARFASDDADGGRALIKRFEEIKAACGPAIPATALGL